MNLSVLLAGVTAMPVDDVSATVGGEEGTATSAYQIWNAVRVPYYTLYHSILPTIYTLPY